MTPRSSLVCASRRSTSVPSTAIQTGASGGRSASTLCTRSARNASISIFLSARAAYTLGHFRSKNGECDSSGSERACGSLSNPSHRLNNASARYSRHAYTCCRNAFHVLKFMWRMLLVFLLLGTLLHQAIFCHRGWPEFTFV